MLDEKEKPTDITEPQSSQDSGLEPRELSATSDPSSGGYYEPDSQGSQPIKQFFGKFSGQNAKRNIAIGGGVAASIIAAFISIQFIITNQIIAWRTAVDQKMSERTAYISDKRMIKHYKYVFDEDGRATLKKRGVKGVVGERLLRITPQKVVADLKKKGVNAEINTKTGKVFINGVEMSSRSAARAEIRAVLEQKYPQDGFMKRSLRTSKAFQALGIRRVFFEKTREKSADIKDSAKVKAKDRLDFISKLRERQKGQTVTGVTATRNPGEQDKASQEAADRTQALNEALGTEEDVATAQEEYDDPEKRSVGASVEVNPEKVAAEAAKESAKGVATGAFKLGGIVDDYCLAYTFANFAENGAVMLRERQLIRYAAGFYVASDQVKAGDNIDPKLMNQMMIYFGDIGKSGGFQKLTGANPNAKINTIEKYAPNPSKYGNQNQRAFGKLQDLISGGNSGALKGVCKVNNTWVFQGLSLVGGITLAVFTGGGSSAVLGAAKGIAGAAVRVGVLMMQPLAVSWLAGTMIDGYETPEEAGDALVAGSDVLANRTLQMNGGGQITQEEAVQLAEAAQVHEINKNKNESIYKRYFAIGENSTLNHIVATSDLNRPIASSIASSLRSLTNLGNIFNIFSKRSLASNNNTYISENPFGVTQYGLTDAEIDAYDPVENEDYILGTSGVKQQYDDYAEKCFNPEVSPSENLDDSGNLKSVCNERDPLTTRFRLYHLDKTLSNGLDFMIGNTDCIDPDSENVDCDGEGSVNESFGSDALCATTSIKEPPSDYSKVTYGDKRFNNRTKQMILQAESIYGGKFTISQGSYNAGGVSQSAGTHDGGGALDVSASSLDPKQRNKAVEALRRAGFAAWLRTPDQGDWGYHIHAIAIGDAELSPGAKSQVTDYFNGRNGLSGNGKDSHPDIGRPIPEWARKYGTPLCPA